MGFLGFPWFAWIGAVTFILLVTQVCLGAAMMKGKSLLKYHRMNAVAIIVLAMIHLIFAILFLLGKYIF